MPGAAAATATTVTFVGVPVFTTSAFLASVAVAVGNVAISIVVGSLLSSKPKKSSFGSSSAAQRSQDRTITVKQPIAAHRIIYGEMRVGGVISFLEATDNNDKLHQLVTIAGHEVNSIGQVYVDDLAVTVSSNEVTDTKYANKIEVYFGKGTTATDSSLHTALIANSDSWTSSHLQTGRAKMYTEFTYDQDVFGAGLPSITAVVQGRKVFDPRDSSTAYSTNAALCIRDYLTSVEFGLGEPSARINDTSFQTAANVCDENVTLSAGGTEKRYTLNGTFEVDEQPKDILKQMLSSCAGKLVYQGGEWSLYAGAYVTPTMTLDEDDLDSGIQITTQVGRRAIFNTVRSVYTNPANLYQPTDAPVINNSTYIAEDQSEVIAKDFDFAFTTSVSMAQRLAKLELEKVRQQITVLMPVSLRNGMRLQAGDTVGVSNTRMGWTDKAFNVEEWSFAQRGDAESPRLGVDLVLRETASAVYDWNSGEETEVDPAPDTDLPDPFTAAVPTSLTMAESLYVTTNGSGVKVRATLSWTASADSFVQEYQTEYKLSADSTWTQAGKAFAGLVTHPINDLAAGTYDFRVKAINSLGVSSGYTTISTQTVAGLTANPADITGLSVVAINNNAHISWDLHPDLDVRHGGKIRFRHSNLSDGTAEWASSTDIGSAVAGHNSDTTLPLVSGTYMARAVDSTGNESLTETSFAITTVPNITNMNAVATVTAHPDFDGTLVGLDVVDGVLKFESVSNFDDRTALLDTWTFFDSYTSGVDTAGTYEFDGVDLGAVYTSRLTHSITFNTFEIGDYIDSRTGNVDSYTDWDNPPADLNLDLYVATTNDQVSGSPTWGAWTKFKTGDFTARGFKFKLAASSTDADHQFNVTALSITVDMPDQVKGEKDIASGVGTKSVAFPSAFFAVPSVGITANNMGTGDYFTVVNKTASGFDITFYNSSASAVDRNFNYQARGY